MDLWLNQSPQPDLGAKTLDATISEKHKRHADRGGQLVDVYWTNFYTTTWGVTVDSYDHGKHLARTVSRLSLLF